MNVRSTGRSFKRLELSILVGLTAVALGLRLVGIQFGLPYLYHYDEHFYINTALRLGTGVLNYPPYAPPALSNVLLAEFGFYFVLGKLLGIFASARQLETVLRTDPTVFYLLGRITIAAVGAATVPALYVLAKTVADRLVGLVAAALLAVAFLHVRDSHYAVPDIAMAFMIVVSAASAALAVRWGKRRYLYAAAFLSGIAAATKWSCLPGLLACLAAGLLLVDGAGRPVARRILSRTTLYAALLVVLGFAVGAPQIVLNPWPYLHEALGQMGAGESGGFEMWQVDTVPGWWFYGKTLVIGMGAILAALGAFGLGRRLWLAFSKRDALSIMALAFPVVQFLLLGATRHYFARYALPFVPFVALFAAEALVVVVRWVSQTRVRPGVALAGCLVLAVAYPTVQSARFDWLLTRGDTRTEAKQWIESNIPAGARIAVDLNTFGPPLSTQDVPVPYAQKVYDLTVVNGVGLADHDLRWYCDNRFDYLIVSSFVDQIPLTDPVWHAHRRDFYASLDSTAELIHEFRPVNSAAQPSFVFDEIYGPFVSLWQRQRPGPTLKVYALANWCGTAGK